MTKSFPSFRSVACAVVIVAIMQAVVGCSAPDRAMELVPYLGQSVPGPTAEHFAPGIVNTDAIEINGVFTPDGRTFFFARQIEGVFTIFRSDFGETGWTSPTPMEVYPNDVRALAVDMTVTTDGKSLYFLGQHVHEDEIGPPNLDIWVVRRDGNSWGFAELVPPPVSTGFSESYPVVVKDGSLYFSSQRPGGFGGYDIYRSQRLQDGSFEEPLNLGPPINTEFHEGDTFVAPDESYLILSSRRPGGLGQNDLYVSFLKPDGGWSDLKNLGPEINSDQTDFCPMVTPDGKYLFFSRRTGATWNEATEGEILWVDISVIERFRS
jgi:Tol biopolymer transport system component